MRQRRILMYVLTSVAQAFYLAHFATRPPHLYRAPHVDARRKMIGAG